jgi:hypothetical protein
MNSHFLSAYSCVGFVAAFERSYCRRVLHLVRNVADVFIHLLVFYFVLVRSNTRFEGCYQLQLFINLRKYNILSVI